MKALPITFQSINACTQFETFILFIRCLKFFACFRLNFPANVVSSAAAPADSFPTATADPTNSIAASPINAAALAAALNEEIPTKAVAPAAAPTNASVVAPAGGAARLRARCT